MFCWSVHLKGSPRGGGFALVTVGHEVYSIGGPSDGDGDQMGVHVFNTVSLSWRKLSPVTPRRGERDHEVPSSRENHTAVLIEDTIYIWGGGYPYPYCNVLYGFDVDAQRWFKPRVSGTVPEGRFLHSACVLGKVVFIYGGYTQHRRFTNYIYNLDTRTMVWS